MNEKKKLDNLKVKESSTVKEKQKRKREEN